MYNTIQAKLIFRGIKTIYLILSTLVGILYIQNTICSVSQSYQWAFAIIALKWVFWLLKPKWCLGKKFMAFQQFSSNGNR